MLNHIYLHMKNQESRRLLCFAELYLKHHSPCHGARQQAHPSQIPGFPESEVMLTGSSESAPSFPGKSWLCWSYFTGPAIKGFPFSPNTTHKPGAGVCSAADTSVLYPGGSYQQNRSVCGCKKRGWLMPTLPLVNMLRDGQTWIWWRNGIPSGLQRFPHASKQTGWQHVHKSLSISSRGWHCSQEEKNWRENQVWKKKAKNLPVGCFLLTREPMLSVVRKNPGKG